MSHSLAWEKVKLQCTPLCLLHVPLETGCPDMRQAAGRAQMLASYKGKRLTFALLLIVGSATSSSCTALKIAIISVHHADAEGTHQHH